MSKNEPTTSVRVQEIESLIESATTSIEASTAMNYALDALLEESDPLTAAEAGTVRTLVNRKIKELLAEERGKKPC